MQTKKKVLNSIIETLRKEFIGTITLSKSANTVGAYSIDLVKFTDWLKSAKRVTRIDKVTVVHVTQFLTFYKELGHADSSIKRMCSSLKSFYKFLIKIGRLEKNIMDIIDSPMVEQSVPSIPGTEEIKRMMALADGNTPRSLLNRAMMELLYSSGLRASELCELQLKHYSPDKREVTVVVGKRNKTRTVPITDTACAWINRYIQEVRGRDDGYIFINMADKHMKRELLGKIVKKYAKKAGISHFTAHTFRHACASHLLQKGADLRLIQKVLGHASIASTQRYTHLTSIEINNKFQDLHATLQ